MQYVDVPFPPRIAMGAQRHAGWKTVVVQTGSGDESTNQQWSKARHRFDVSFAVRTATDFAVVQAHHHMMRGRAKKFPFRDAVDYRVEASNGVLVDSEGSPTLYQLAKSYGTGGDRYDRRITRPRTGYVSIFRTRAGVTTDISGSSSVSFTTGEVTITPGTVIVGDALAWAGQFWVPCRYDTDELPSITVNRRGGADGELLVTCDSIPLCEVRE